MKDDGDALVQSSINESARRESQDVSLEMDDGQLFAHRSTACSVRGTDDPKPETLPAVIHLPRPPWYWPDLHSLIFFQALKCDLSPLLSTTQLQFWIRNFILIYINIFN